MYKACHNSVVVICVFLKEPVSSPPKSVIITESYRISSYPNSLLSRQNTLLHISPSWTLIDGGIPQGSALRPLLFLIYMNIFSSVTYNTNANDMIQVSSLKT